MSNDDYPICPHCDGSGEGMYDGSSCYSCRGTGVERDEEDDYSYADYLYDKWKDERWEEEDD